MTLRTKDHRGLARFECIVITMCVLLLLAISLPALAGSRGAHFSARSNANLWSHGIANAMYAADWNGAQVSFINNDISVYGNTLQSAFTAWSSAHGSDHPGLTLGWGPLPDGSPTLYRYRTNNLANAALTQPFTFNGPAAGFGSFRFANARGYREYLASSFYAPAFYAPTDQVVRPLVEPGYDSPWEYAALEPAVPSLGNIPYLSSYIFSPAAMFHPDVFRRGDAGGWTDPWSIDHGFQSPAFFSARYSNLKTLMIEHHWLQNAPKEVCNPGFEYGLYDECEPYYFNHGIDSAPNSLFFDLSVRELPNAEVAAADAALIRKTSYGLWSRDTPFGNGGYFGDEAYDTTNLSHHIFTTDGILGRDTLNR